MQLEFEQKFVLDLDALSVIHDIIRVGAWGKPKQEDLWQCYGAKKSNRYRGALDRDTGRITLTKEIKESIKLPVPYAINSEKDEEIKMGTFIKNWSKSGKRLTKMRWTFRGACMMDSTFPVDHKLMIDLFLPIPSWSVFGHLFPTTSNPPYALIAEVETVLGVNTTALNLDFALPQMLQPYCLKTVDKREADKAFTAYSLCYTPEVAENTRRVINGLKNG